MNHGAYAVEVLRDVDNGKSIRLLCRELQIGFAGMLEKVAPLDFEAIGVAAPSRALHRRFYGCVEQDSQIGPQIAMNKIGQPLDALLWKPTGAALIRTR